LNKVRGTGDSASSVLFSGLSFPDQGLRPGFALLTAGTKIQVNASWPFTIPVDPGYLPWDYTNNYKPKLTPTWPGTQYRVTDQISFSAQALDYESGNLSSAISWSSSKDGALGTGAQLTQTLSPGTHAITASVTDPNNNTGHARS
jgi:hypothetical protein